MRVSGRLLCVFAIVVSGVSGVHGGQRTFVLREHLRQTWTGQLVTFPFQADKGQCHRDSPRLIEIGIQCDRSAAGNQKGPKGPLPCQLSDVRLWPGDTPFVKSANVSFVVDLGPLETQEYVLHFDREPIGGKAVESDLQIRPGDDQVEFSTSRFGAKLLLGEKTYDPPAPADKVPGPLVAMRLADGTWFGGSRMYGKTAIKGYSSRLVSPVSLTQCRLLGHGPVLAEVALRYTYADGNVMELLAQMVTGDSAVYWDMDVKQERRKDGWQLVLSRGLPALSFPVQMEFYTKRRCFLECGAKVGDRAELPLDQYPDELITKLTPWSDWWDDYTQTVIRLRMKGSDSELQIASRDAGSWVKPVPPGGIGPGPGLKRLPLKRSKDGEVFLEVNLAAGDVGGIRRWSVAQRNVPTWRSPGPNKEIAERMIQARTSNRQLNIVKDWVLRDGSTDWPRKAGSKHPHLFATAEDVERVRRGGKPNPEAIKTAQYVAREAIRPVPSYKDSQALAAWLITGDRQLAEELKLVERLRRHLGLLGNFDLMRHTVVVAALYDALIDTDLVPEEEKPVLRAQMAQLGYKLADPATWSMERGYASGNPNMTVSYLLSLGMVACTIPDHPMARQWVQPALDLSRDWLAKHVGPKGEWFESAHYSQVSAAMFISFAVAARNAGFAFGESEEAILKRFMGYLAQQYTPRDPRRGGFRASPPAVR